MAKKIKTHPLKSELEALLIEAELINAHQPFYNSLLKDDKSNIYLLVTAEKFPRLLRLRRTDLKKSRYQNNLAVLGPFQSSYKLNEVLKIVRPIFPWCNKQNKTSNKACLYYHLELCPGACCQKISPEDYRHNIDNLILFLRAKKKIVLKNLTQEMKTLADKEKFEAAQAIKEKIALIKEVTEENFHLKPDLILPNFTQSENKEGLVHLRRIMHQEKIIDSHYQLKRLEGYDVSNTQGKQATVSMVTFINGFADKSEYKFFKIRSLSTPNDYAMLQEALERRKKHPEWGKADLLVIDGGKGQLRSVNKIWQMANPQLACPVISLVKNPDRLVLAKPNPNKKDGFETLILNLGENHPTIKLLQQIRNESHRFAKKHHTRLRQEKILK